MPDRHDKPRIAVFDFCETIADFQTATAFVDYTRQHSRHASIRLRHVLFVFLVKSQLVRLFDAATGHRHSTGKLLKLKELRGLTQAETERMALQFYKERVKPHLIGPIVKEMQRLQGEGWSVGLSSGGYDVYLKHFVQDYGLDFCQCSELAFRNGRCTGKVVGKDCMRQEKVRRLNAAFGEGAGAVAYSDSPSDLPLLQWAERGVVVSHGWHQNWIEKYHFEEIIW